MPFQWSDQALESLADITLYYEIEADRSVADVIEGRIFEQVESFNTFPMSAPESEIFPGMRKVVISHLPYVAFIRRLRGDAWEVVDVVHTSRRLPKNS